MCQRLLKVSGSSDALYGLLAITYFVFDPEAPMYKHLDKAARINRVLESHVEKKIRRKVEDLLSTDEYNLFKKDYLNLVATPAKQMLRAFVDEVHNFVAQTNGGDYKGEELQARIKQGRQLLMELEELEVFVMKEGKSKTRADYRPTLYERRESAVMKHEQ
jgi:hypothetical protein